MLSSSAVLPHPRRRVMSNPPHPESPSDKPSPDDPAPGGPDAAGAVPNEEEEAERDAEALRTAVGALRARLAPASAEDKEDDQTDD